MNDWIRWAIPIAAVVLWIVVNILRAPQQQKPAPRRPRPAPPRPNRPPAREHPLTDLDRFLQDVQRRRDEAERRETPPPVPPVVREARPPVLQPVQDYEEAIPLVLPAPPRQVIVDDSSIQRRIARAAAARKAAPAIAVDIRQLLRNPESVRSAFVMREILDRPVSKRGRRR